MSEAILERIETAGVRVEPILDLHRWSVRVLPDERGFLERLFDLQLPVQALRSFRSEHGTALWLGPDEWLVLLNSEGAQRFAERSAQTDWSAVPPASVVEVTHRSLGLELTGPRAAWVLNCGCPLELSEERFPPGSCTRTLLGKVDIVLHRTEDAEPCFYLECWRSFMPYLWTRLRTAIAECTAETSGALP